MSKTEDKGTFELPACMSTSYLMLQCDHNRPCRPCLQGAQDCQYMTEAPSVRVSSSSETFRTSTLSDGVPTLSELFLICRYTHTVQTQMYLTMMVT